MSVRVNLLPRETYARQLASRQRGLAGIAALCLLLVLGGVYWWQLARVSDAADELAVEEARVADLQAEVAALTEFDELQVRHEEAESAMRATLQGEVTFAGLLQDVAAVMPADSQMDSLSITIEPSNEDEAPGATAVGTFTATGQTLTSHAPGVERLLLSLDKVASFSDLFVNSSTLGDAEQDIASFSIEAEIGPEVMTGRYADGLPEELR